MHEKRFHRAIERLRDPQRVQMLERTRVVELALAGLAVPISVLDVGTGSGLFAEEFAAQGLKVSGLDANSEMLPIAQGFVPSGVFREGVAEKLPFEAGEFDIVFMGLVLHETDDPQAAIREAHRVAKQRLAVLEWPYAVQDVGPGLDEQLSEEKIMDWASTAGFKALESARLNKLVLYRFDK